MRTERSSLTRIVPLLIVAVVPFAVASCSEPAEPQGTAGTGGTGAAGGVGGAGGTTGGGAGVGTGGTTGGTAGGSTGGTSGTGGSVAGAGTGGMSGSGGSAGAPLGGAGAGGMSGAGGGMSGAAGTGAGAGGTTAGSAGMGGMSGTAGAAGSGGTAGGASGAAGSSSGAFTLTSPDHAEGAMFADPYTCAEAGFNGSIIPELHWTPGPAGTMSYAITFIDITLGHATPPQANGYHWVIWNIPADVLTLPEGFKDQMSIMAQENRDFLGPCPNVGGGSANTDTYEFTIYALAEESITISPTTGTGAVQDAEEKLEAMNLDSAKLTGTSNAAP